MYRYTTFINLFTLAVLFLNHSLFAQTGITSSEPVKPDWSGGEGFQTEFYDYYVGYAESDTLEKARKNATYDALRKIATKMNVTIDVNSISEQKTESVKVGKEETLKSEFNFKGTVNEKSQSVTIAGLRSVDSYYHKSRAFYQYWILIRKPLKIPDADLTPYTYSKGHIWRSILLPGWGQLRLGYKTKGAILLTSTAVLVGGVVASQVMYNNNYNDYLNNLKLGHTDDAEVYKSNADSWYLIRNVTLVALGGVYLYNLIDVFTKKGIKVFAFNNKRVDVFPTYCYDAAMINLRIKL